MTDLSGPSLELRRDVLLERVERVAPKLVTLVAPAGFGKSTLARQLVAGRPAAVCDVTGVSGDLDFARRLLPALAQADPERTKTLVQCELRLGDASVAPSERLASVLDAWKVPSLGTIVVIENVEHAARNDSALEFLTRLLATQPPGRQVVICSREPLRVHLTRFASPHEILSLRAEDLAFDRFELARLFEAEGGDPRLVPRILQLSQGWPIAVFLLKRFAKEGRIAQLLDRLNDVAFDELHDYLADQILSGLEPKLVEALFACASIPHATIADLQAALHEEESVGALVEFARESPFVRRGADGTFSVHPLMASQLLEGRIEARDRILLRAAAAHSHAKHYQRAAELHLARGDSAAAAHALGQHEVARDPVPSMAYARILASLDRALVQRYPRLWSVTALFRMFCTDTEDLLDEAESMWRMISRDAVPAEQLYILAFRALFMSYIGMTEEALELLDRFAAENAAGEEPKNAFEGFLHYLTGLMHARLGRIGEAERRLQLAMPLVGAMDVTGSGTMLALGADVERVRGRFAAARQFLERAIESARRSGLLNYLALTLSEAAFGAWLGGDDDDFNHYVVELDSIVHENGVRGFAYFAGAARGRTEEPQDTDLLKWVACGRIMQAASASDVLAAARYARAAVTAARQFGTPFIEVLALVALAAFDGVAFDDHIREALELAQRCDSPALVDAVRSIGSHGADFGMLDALMSRLQRRRTQRDPVLEIGLVDGSIRCQGRDVTLSEREHALLAALALRHETVSRSRLAAMLWPDLDEYAARNALSVCLHRLRGHLGTEDAIARTKDGYAVGEDVRVDLWDFDRAMGALRPRATISEAESDLLDRMYEALRKPRPDRLTQWEWFESTDRHIRDLRLEVAQRLAAHVLARGTVHRALELAQDMISADPCDEAARHIAITAHLAMGDRSAAMRQYRQYRETLMAELQCEPSDEIKRLVGVTGAA